MRRVVILAGLALVFATSAVAGQRSLVIEEMHSEIQVLPDGDIIVTETLKPRFRGSWNGIRRVISLNPPASYEPDYLLDVRLVSATDGVGRTLRHEMNQSGRDTREFRIWVPDARDRVATVVATYRVGNALGHFEADSASGTPPWDELYWQATGTDWEVPILRASARVHLPEGASHMQSAAYFGSAADANRVDVRVEPDGSSVFAGPVGPLSPGRGLTIAVGWPGGFVARPAPGERAARSGTDFDPRDYWPLLLPVLVFGFAYRAWSQRGRDPAERAITTRWEPPEGLTPAEAGTLVDHHAGIHDVVSTLVALAVKGYLVIEEGEKEGLFAWGREYTFHAVRPREEWMELPEHERLFLEALFDAFDTTVKLSDLKNQFYTSIPEIKSAIQRALVFRGYYARRPDRVRMRWMFFALTPLVAAGPSSGIIFRGSGAPPGLTVGLLTGALLMSGLILGAFGWFMPARTPAGARTREAVLGFKRFLERVEAPRYRRMITSPDLFEAYLPFAMAFQCEERWAKAFDGLLTEPPQWYRGSSGGFFRPAIFARELGSLSTAARSTLSSSPSSSASGGFGSVGGGGGGGGGGGF